MELSCPGQAYSYICIINQNPETEKLLNKEHAIIQGCMAIRQQNKAETCLKCAPNSRACLIDCLSAHAHPYSQSLDSGIILDSNV